MMKLILALSMILITGCLTRISLEDRCGISGASRVGSGETCSDDPLPPEKGIIEEVSDDVKKGVQDVKKVEKL